MLGNCTFGSRSTFPAGQRSYPSRTDISCWFRLVRLIWLSFSAIRNRTRRRARAVAADLPSLRWPVVRLHLHRYIVGDIPDWRWRPRCPQSGETLLSNETGRKRGSRRRTRLRRRVRGHDRTMAADVLDLRSILLQLRLCLISAKQGLVQCRSQSRAVRRDSSESVRASKASFGQ